MVVNLVCDNITFLKFIFFTFFWVKHYLSMEATFNNTVCDVMVYKYKTYGLVGKPNRFLLISGLNCVSGKYFCRLCFCTHEEKNHLGGTYIFLQLPIFPLR